MSPPRQWRRKKSRRPSGSQLQPPQAEFEAPAAGAALPEASVVEGKCSAVVLAFPIE
jgi:hypothetical protein